MKPRNEMREAHSAAPILDLPCHPAGAAENSPPPRVLKPAVCAILACTLLAVQPAFSQQGYAAPQPWPTDDSYGSAYPSSQQPGYAQPGYGQQQPYSQQPNAYAPQNYPPQPNVYAPQYYQQQNLQQPGYQQGAPDQGQQGYAQAPVNADQLEQLVAPIALYPDALLAQILAASTYPAQVAAADQWLQSLGNVSSDQVAGAVSAQTEWDPSVKALTAFPQVLSMLDHNLQWTTALGNAYYNQPQDVLQTVQVMRQRAEQAGNLQSTPQENVVDNQGYIALAPANPQVVYVPTYNPWLAYGQPVSPYPGFSFFGALGSFLGSSLQYGLGFGMTAFSHSPFGLLSWGLDWLANTVLFNHSSYVSHSNSVADWGFPHGGPRAYPGGAMARYGNGYNRPYARPEQGYGRGAGQAIARPEGSFANRPQEGLNRGYQTQGYGRPVQGYARPALPQQQAYNHMAVPIARPRSFENRAQALAPRTQGYGTSYARPGYGSSFNQRPAENYASRQGMSYAAPSQSYRPGANYARGFEGGSSKGFSGGYGQQAKSGGFHPFGGGHESQGFGGGHAPKSFGGGHSSKGFGGGGHSSHSGGHSGGGHKR